MVFEGSSDLSSFRWFYAAVPSGASIEQFACVRVRGCARVYACAPARLRARD